MARGPRQRVGDNVHLARLMGETEVVLHKIESPVSLPANEVLRSLSILEVVVICSDVEQLREAFEKLLPVFQSLNDGEHLAVPDFVVLFCRTHSLESECNWMPEFIFRV